MGGEALQHSMLTKQNISNTWRCAAYKKLLVSTAPPAGAQLFVNGTAYAFELGLFGQQEGTVSGPIMMVTPPHADRDLDHAEAVKGAVAVCTRGGVGASEFVLKAQRCQAAGAVAMVVINVPDDEEEDQDGEQLFSIFAGDEHTEVAKSIKIPCILIKSSDGSTLKGASGARATLALDGGRYALQSRFWGPVPDSDVAEA